LAPVIESDAVAESGVVAVTVAVPDTVDPPTGMSLAVQAGEKCTAAAVRTARPVSPRIL
jgi:hypothetical protein